MSQKPSPRDPLPATPLYKGEPLDAARGPGLGCFWAQVAVLAVLLVLTPLTVIWAWPPMVSGVLLIVTLILLLFAGQTVIFLLRLVAADRRTRRRPLGATARRTVGDLEEGTGPEPAADAWQPLRLPARFDELFEAAAAHVREVLETNEQVLGFVIADTADGSYGVIQGADPSGPDHELLTRAQAAVDGVVSIAAVTGAKLLLPGLRRPTDAIQIRLIGDESVGPTVAIRYESEGPHRYRYWDPVMTERPSPYL